MRDTRPSLKLAFAFALFGGCAPAEIPRERYNVVLISIDTLRADHLGAYGYSAKTSPNIDLFARSSIVFERTSAQAPSTLSSHASIFTSQIPQHHGASRSRELPLADEAITLTEILAGEGYQTASWNSGGQLAAIYRLNQGFEIYEEGPDPFDWGLERGQKWLEGHLQRGDSRPFFLFLHTYEVHHPYTPRPEDLALFAKTNPSGLPAEISIEKLTEINSSKGRLDAEDLAYIVATYDAEIHAVDRSFGRWIDFLRSKGLLEKTILILTSDHGEEFGEHGKVGWHSHTLYEELLHVPLIFRLPEARLAGTRLPLRVRSIDIAPTLLDLLGIAAPVNFEGRSLVPLMLPGGVLEEAPAIALRDNPRGWDIESFALRRLKITGPQLFDLEADPWEQRDLAAVDPDSWRRLHSELRRIVEQRKRLESKAVVLGDEERERLRALGYVGESADEVQE